MRQIFLKELQPWRFTDEFAEILHYTPKLPLSSGVERVLDEARRYTGLTRSWSAWITGIWDR